MVQSKNTEKIWYKDLGGVFLDQDNLIRFIPDKNYTLTQNLNATMRFAIYFAIVVFVIRRDYRVFFFVAFVALVTFMIDYQETQTADVKNKLLERLNVSPAQRNGDTTKGYCVRPTVNNPFMNVLLSDYQEFPNRPAACDVTRRSIKNEIKANYDNGLYRDIDDIFHKKASDRQFYTTPVTTIPNDQNGFAEWCYKPPPTCKERTKNCTSGVGFATYKQP